MEMLPDEMWEEILKFVDVLDLVRLKRVSKYWQDMITRVIERECKWYEKCVKVVPKVAWTSILEHNTHPKICCDNLRRSRMHSEIWVSLYKSWIGWSTLTEKRSSARTVEIFRENEDKEISCIDAKSNIIGIGTGSDERIIFYDVSEFPGAPIFEADHGTYVVGLDLGRVDGDTIAVSNSCMGVTDLQYWNLRTKTQIHRHVSRKYRNSLSTSFEYCHMVEHEMDDSNVPYYLLKVERMGSGIDLRSTHVSITKHGFIITIRADGSKMILLISDYELPIVRVYTCESNDDLKVVYVIHTDELPDCPYRTLLLLQPCGVVAYTATYEGTEFGFSINGRKWKQYNVRRDLGLDCGVKYIWYHVGNLLLGLTSGDVLIISVKHVDGLESLDLKSMQSKMLKLDTRPIIALKVTEHNSCQYLVAVSEKKVHLVKFD